MRAKDFLVPAEQQLFEINMSPGNLKKLAKEVPAIVGLEFEMVVPGVGAVSGDDLPAPEPDYDQDETAVDIDDVCRFFYDGDYNSRQDIARLRRILTDKFEDWQVEQARREWESDGKEKFAEWCRENVSTDEVADELDIPEDLFGDRIPSKEDWEKFIDQEWQEEGIRYDNAFDEYLDRRRDEEDFDQEEFLREIGIETMHDVYSSTWADIQWPLYDTPEFGEGNPEDNLSELAEEFSQAVGMPVNYSTDYHGGYRTPGEYDIEPDASISASGNDAGLEFISPPLPLDQAIEQIKLVKKWADERGCHTNRSTGLHMNISVPGFSRGRLDFVKLVLLLGDKYILDKFGRSANSYCKSAMEIIKDATLEDRELLFSKLKSNMNSIASKIIHTGEVEKFTSINPKADRVEFRSPGGDWLGKNYESVEETLNRCAVALEAAIDPTMYRKEYLKKLVKMFAPSKGSIEDIFLQWTAGTITRTELKAKLKSVQKSRKEQKLTDQGIVEIEFFANSSKGDWIVEYEQPGHFKVYRLILKRTQQVNTNQQAFDAAVKVEPSWFNPNDIENITVTENTGKHDFIISRDGIDDETILAYTPLQALEFLFASYPHLKTKRDSIQVRRQEQDPRSYQTADGRQARLAPDEQLFRVRNMQLGTEVQIAANSGATAIYRASRNRPEDFPGGNENAHNVATPVNSSDGQVRMWKVSGQTQPFITQTEYVAAETIQEALSIARTLYPNLFRVQTPDIVLFDSDRSSISAFQARQERTLSRLRNPDGEESDGRQPSLAPGEGQLYNVRDAGTISGGITIRASSPEHAILRARQAYNISPDHELVATLYDNS